MLEYIESIWRYTVSKGLNVVSTVREYQIVTGRANMLTVEIRKTSLGHFHDTLTLESVYEVQQLVRVLKLVLKEHEAKE